MTSCLGNVNGRRATKHKVYRMPLEYTIERWKLLFFLLLVMALKFQAEGRRKTEQKKFGHIIFITSSLVFSEPHMTSPVGEFWHQGKAAVSDSYLCYFFEITILYLFSLLYLQSKYFPNYTLHRRIYGKFLSKSENQALVSLRHGIMASRVIRADNCHKLILIVILVQDPIVAPTPKYKLVCQNSNSKSYNFHG